MDVVVLIARILFAGIFLTSAVGHLTATEMMTGYTASRGVPLPKLNVVLSGVLLAIGGLSVLLGVYGDVGALILAALMLGVAVMMQHFWTDEGEARMQTQIQFFKDLALAGGALAFFLLFRAGDVPYALTAPFFS